MSKATWENFCREKLISRDLEANPAAKKIFDFLNEDEKIYMMIQTVKLGKPVMQMIVDDLEKFADENNLNEEFNLAEDVSRTTVGRMIRTILEPFGYVSSGTQKTFKAKYFRSSSTYNFAPEKVQMIARAVVEEV